MRVRLSFTPLIISLGRLVEPSMALRLHNRRLYPLSFLVGSAVVIAAWWRFDAAHRSELLATAIVGVASFTYFLYRQHLDEAKLFKELFTEFNLRYDTVNDDINAILIGPRDGALSAREKDRLFSYFNLCAEEYFFYKAGYIDRQVWESWCRGMKAFYKHPRIQPLWDEECKSDSYYDFRPPQ
jgi:hypothetical protein